MMKPSIPSPQQRRSGAGSARPPEERRGKAKRWLSALTAATLAAGMLPAYASAAPEASSLPAYFNPALTPEKRAEDLLARMTVEEKVGQMVQAERASVTPEDVRTYHLGSVLSGGGSFPGGKQADSTLEKWTELYESYQNGALSTRLGIPLLYGVDAVHGHNNVKGATLFPHNIGLAAAGDVKLAEQVGEAAATEIRATGVNWTFAPALAVVQDIRWGRTYEGFGDDPALAARLGAAYIKGLQGEKPEQLADREHVVATAKHFVGEGYTAGGVNQGNVTAYSEEEIWQREKSVYEAAVQAGVGTVMASYHSIQGLKMHANKRLLQDKLKGELGFKGFVISDYNAIDQITRDSSGAAVSGLKAQVRTAVNAGVDMIMEPDKWKQVYTELKALAEEGAVPMSRIDDAVTRILTVKFRSGVFEQPYADRDMQQAFGSEASRAVAREAVSRSLVLLKNDFVRGADGGEAPILSLLPTMKNLLVAGKNASDIGRQSGGWSITWQGSSGAITPGTTILEGLQAAAKATGAAVTFNEHGRGAAGKDAAIVVLGEKPYAEGSGDASSLDLDVEDQATLDNIRAADPDLPIVLVLVSGRPMTVTKQLDQVQGLVAAWLPGTEGAGVADVLLGSREFEGKLPIRWPFELSAYAKPDPGAEAFLFQTGYGLQKSQATPQLPEAPQPETPENPGYLQIEAESFVAQSGIQTEKTQDAGGGDNIGYIDDGDWTEYEVELEGGLYDVEVRYASWGDSSGLRIVDGNKQASATIPLPRINSYQDWGSAAAKDVELPGGPCKQKLRLSFLGGSLNLNWVKLTRTGDAPAPTAVACTEEPGNPGTPIEPEVVQEDAVQSWISRERDPGNIRWYYAPRWQEGDKKLDPQAPLDVVKPNEAKGEVIELDADTAYQSIFGIGSSMEESTVGNLMKMSPEKRHELLVQLFDKEQGAGMSLVRVTIGTADFTGQPFYSYNDLPPGETDPELKKFSIQKDRDLGIISTLKEIQAINPDVKFFGSPWSAPGWMKTTGSMIKGEVMEPYLPVYADYLVKFVQAYGDEGIPIEMLTMQNEPLLEIEYPSTKMSWQQQGRLAALLRTKLDAAGFGGVKILTFDHNPGDTMAYPAQLLRDPAAYEAVDGTAFHDYGGELSEMTRLKELFPEKNVYLTERAVWGTQGADRIAQYFRNWARSYNSWVVMLDSDIRAHQWTGVPDPTPVIQDSADRDRYWLAPETYLMAQFSKFVLPGYERIDSNYGSKDTVTNVAFRSPDGKTIVAVIVNQTASDQPVKLLSDGTQISAVVPAKSVATYRWTRPELGRTAPGRFAAASFDQAEGSYAADAATGVVDGLNADPAQGQAAFDYGVNVRKAGRYTLDLSYAGQPADASVTVKAGGATAAHVPVTRDTYGEYAAVRVRLDLPAGNQQLRLEAAGTGYRLRELRLQPAAGETALPQRVEAEAASSTAHALLLEAPAGASKDAVSLHGGSELNIRIAAPETGLYQLQYRYRTESEAGATVAWSVYGGSPIRSDALLASSEWTTASGTIQLSQGSQQLRLTAADGPLALDWVQLGPVLQVKNNPRLIAVPGTASADDYAAMSGFKPGAGGSADGRQLGESDAGDWADYRLSVPEAGRYTVTLELQSQSGGIGAFRLKLGETVLATYDVPQIYNNWVAVRKTIDLPAGEQTLRLAANASGFNVGSLAIEPFRLQAAGADGALQLEAESYFDGDRNAIETNRSAGTANVGYTNAGNKLHYGVDVPQAGRYKVTYRYATQQPGVSAALLADGQAVGTASLPSTGGWGNYREASGIVALAAGPQQLSVLIQGDGFNLDWLRLAPTDEEPVAELRRADIAKATLKAGKYAKPQAVTLAGGTTDAAVYYTLDGSLPTAESGKRADGPILVEGTAVIRAIAVKDGMDASYVSAFTYVTGPADPQPSTNPSASPQPSESPGSSPTPSAGPTATPMPTYGPIATPAPSASPSAAPTASPGGNLTSGVPKLDVPSGIASVTVSRAELDQAGAAGGNITINVPSAAGASGYAVILPAEALRSGASRLELRLPNGTLLLPAGWLKGAELAGDDVRLTLAEADRSGLAAAQQAASAGLPVYRIGLESGGKPVVPAASHPAARVSVPAKLDGKMIPASHRIGVRLLDASRSIPVPSGRYAAGAVAGSGSMEFDVRASGTYAAVFSATEFRDLTKHAWALRAIEALAARGIVQGVDEQRFQPAAELRRGDLLLLLVRAFEFSADGEASFRDIPAGAYYEEAARIAKLLGLAQGREDGRFDPLAPVSRQELMTLIARAASLAGEPLEQAPLSSLSAFRDSGSVAPYAADSAAALVQAGIVGGDSGALKPQGTASRAETAAMLHRLLGRIG